MKVWRVMRGRWLIGVAGVCTAILLIEITWQHPLDVPVEEMVAPVTEMPVTPSSRKSTEATSTEYQGIATRPLFTMDRRPYKPPVEQQPPEPERPSERSRPSVEFLLTAIITTPTAELALIKSSEFPDIHKVRIGQDVGGWTLVEVGVDAVVLRNGSNHVTVELQPKNAPAADEADDPGSPPTEPIAHQRHAARVSGASRFQERGLMPCT